MIKHPKFDLSLQFKCFKKATKKLKKSSKSAKCVLHNFNLGKVSPANQLLIHQVGFVNSRCFSNIEVVQNTDLRI